MNTPFYGILSARWRWAAIVALLSTFFLSHAAWAAPDPNLDVTLSDNTATAVSNQEITYTIKIVNSGPTVTPTVVFTFPANITFQSALPAPDASTAADLTWNTQPIAAGATARFYVTVKVDSGLSNGTVLTSQVDVTTGSGTNTATDVTTIQAPQLTSTPASLDFGNQRVGTTSAAKTVTLRNTGAQPVVLSASASWSFSVAGYAVSTTTCSGATLAVNATCTIGITFTPPATGTVNSTLSVPSDAPSSPLQISLTGKGTAPAISVTPTSLTFATQKVNTTSAAQVVTITNTGDAPLTFTSTNITGNPEFTSTKTCTTTLAAGASCTISVSFRPTGTGARTQGTLTIVTNASNTPSVPVTLDGTGAAPAVLLSTNSLDFGSQTLNQTTAAQTVTVTNDSDVSLAISSVTIGGTNPGDFAQTNTCSTVAAHGTCTIDVTFKPTAVGARGATLSIASDASGSPHTVDLAGVGVNAGIVLSPTTLAFGDQIVNTVSATQTFTITSSGGAALNVTNVTFPAPYQGTPGTCTGTSFTLNPGSSCTFTVTFAPTSAGDFNLSALIYSNASARPLGVALTGKGVVLAPAVTLSPTSLDFGSVAYGVASPPKTVTLTNSGNATLSITGVVPPSNTDFAVSSDCAATLAAGASCTITVIFTPTVGGSGTGVISVATNADSSPDLIQLTGVGVAPKYGSSPAAGALTISSVIGSSNTVVITVNNTGSATLNVSAPAETVAAPFGVTPATAYTVAAGASAQVAVTCSPTAAGPYSQVLTYTTNDPTLPSVAYNITCNGTATPTAGFASSPAVGGTIAFGDVAANTTATSDLVVSEVGTADLIVGLKGGSLSTALTGAQASSFSVAGAFPLTIADGAAGSTLVVSCGPQAEGDLTATLTLTTNDPAQPEVSYTLTCKGVGTPIHLLYLPLLARATDPADLVVTAFTITPTSLKAGDPVAVSAVVSNNGQTATGGFWVDLYLNPTTAPTAANLPWNETCGLLEPCYGLAWYVEGLAPGASITLTSNEGSYFAQNSNWVGTLAAGTTTAYLYADSWNRDDTNGTRVETGAVIESNESNNRADISGISVSASGLRLKSADPTSLPQRPLHPKQ